MAGLDDVVEVFRLPAAGASIRRQKPAISLLPQSERNAIAPVATNEKAP